MFCIGCKKEIKEKDGLYYQYIIYKNKKGNKKGGYICILCLFEKTKYLEKMFLDETYSEIINPAFYSKTFEEQREYWKNFSNILKNIKNE